MPIKVVGLYPRPLASSTVWSMKASNAGLAVRSVPIRVFYGNRHRDTIPEVAIAGPREPPPVSPAVPICDRRPGPINAPATPRGPGEGSPAHVGGYPAGRLEVAGIRSKACDVQTATAA